jgi:hypothetical protein
MTVIQPWVQGTYSAGDLVSHNGEVYRKVNDADQSEPDAIPGGWELMPSTNLSEFNAIATSFSTYEERVRKHKADTLAKLHAAGLEPADVKAVLEAS